MHTTIDGNTAALDRFLTRVDARTAAVDARKQALLTDGLADLVADVVSQYADSVGEVLESLVAGTCKPSEGAAQLVALVESEADTRAEDDQDGHDDNEACDREWEARRREVAA